MEAVAAVMRALLLLVVFCVLAGVFTRLRVFPRVTACWFPGLVLLEIAATLFHVMARAGATGWSTVVLGGGMVVSLDGLHCIVRPLEACWRRHASAGS